MVIKFPVWKAVKKPSEIVLMDLLLCSYISNKACKGKVLMARKLSNRGYNLTGEIREGKIFLKKRFLNCDSKDE